MKTKTVVMCLALLPSACAQGASTKDFDFSSMPPGDDATGEPASAADGGGAGATPGPVSMEDGGGASVDAGAPPPQGGDSAAGSGAEPDASPSMPPDARADSGVDTPPAVPSGETCGDLICHGQGSATGVDCSSAITLGRASLLDGQPEYLGSLASAGNNQDLAIADCPDEGNDVFYRIYLYPGEILNLSVRNRTSGQDLTVKLYLTDDCSEPQQVVCINKGGPNLSELVYQQPALGEGWHVLVIDGPQGTAGSFSISKTAPLTAAVKACGC